MFLYIFGLNCKRSSQVLSDNVIVHQLESQVSQKLEQRCTVTEDHVADILIEIVSIFVPSVFV